eukprot:gnl/MRDRNA2_/MRDRNA2_143569_c0_seq1.p1 gnl/MRDRNA2_/MRDRNA2_143569_c0~~gnl/MRDRNA2_/MRDRNA2_143569_c0_seq1.p1  ORF type:complete len:153 (+),score=31.59 gnl/MRDRNA2_/MRDRNA2_143569_c0_seq1:93-551(+)
MVDRDSTSAAPDVIGNEEIRLSGIKEGKRQSEAQRKSQVQRKSEAPRKSDASILKEKAKEKQDPRASTRASSSTVQAAVPYAVGNEDEQSSGSSVSSTDIEPGMLTMKDILKQLRGSLRMIGAVVVMCIVLPGLFGVAFYFFLTRYVGLLDA